MFQSQRVPRSRSLPVRSSRWEGEVVGIRMPKPVELEPLSLSSPSRLISRGGFLDHERGINSARVQGLELPVISVLA